MILSAGEVMRKSVRNAAYVNNAVHLLVSSMSIILQKSHKLGRFDILNVEGLSLIFPQVYTVR